MGEQKAKTILRSLQCPWLALGSPWRENSRMPHQFNTSYTQDATDLFRYYKKLAERAMEQCPEEGLFRTFESESNSIAIVVKHLAGSMRSRWTDFLTTDGEKPDRNRDSEFEEPASTREELLAMWESGWAVLLDTTTGLSEADLTKTITIRSEPHSVMQAINRQVAHYSYHCGQIVFIAKHFRGAQWQSLSVPRGGSGGFNEKVLRGEASQR